MEITGDEQKGFQTINQLNINQVKDFFNKYGLVLADYLTRDQEYKDEMFIWIVQNNNKIKQYRLIEIIEYLLDNGADINAKNNYGWTALIWASRNGHKDIVKLLLDNNADINVQHNNGFKALIWASVNGYEDIVKLLLDNSANINAKDKNGYTALIWASVNGHKDMVQLLLDSQNSGYFYEFDKLPPEIQEEIIRRLEKDAEKEAKSPIILASEGSNLDLVNYLMDKKL